MGGKNSKKKVVLSEGTVTTTTASSDVVQQKVHNTDEKTSKQKVVSSRRVVTNMAASSDVVRPKQRIIQNFVLIWVDANIDSSSKDCKNTLAQLRSVVNDVTICTQQDQCIQILNGIDVEQAFVIVSGSLGQDLVPDIHTMSQVDAIYIFCGDKSRQEQWTKQWAKIKGVHTDIKPICEALRLAAKQCNEDNNPISFVPMGEGASSLNLDQLQPSFMYTQIFKEILFEMDFNQQSIKDLSAYCRKFHENNNHELNNIYEFERDYRPQLSIWWYTRECFTYHMLNRALRNLEADTIINMGFFLRDLHYQLKELHKKQVSGYHGKPFTVYRGQRLSTTDFQKLRKNKGGLLSFSIFLSTSTKRDVALEHVKDASGQSHTVGIIFRMSINPSVSSAPFAAIHEMSFYPKEEEILFSMHTVFRTGEIKKLDNRNFLYQVDLRLTSDDDPQLRALTTRIREETSGSTASERLGQLLLKIGSIDKAEELYKELLEQTSDEDQKAHYYTQLGYVKDERGNYEEAIRYYEMGLHIKQKTLPRNHPSLATSYNNIGSVYKNLQEYSKALSFYEKALEIWQKTLPSNQDSLAASYNNIGGVYKGMREYSKALSFYNKALAICEKNLPPNHPYTASSCNNIGGTYMEMRQYLEALSYMKRALNIYQLSLPPNHPSIQNIQKGIEMVEKKL